MIAELQLARVEGWRLLRNPVVWLGLAPTVMLVTDDPSTDPNDVFTGRYYALIGYGLLLPGFVVVVMTILAVLRSRSTGADGLLATMPVGADRRSIGHGYSVLAAAMFAGLATAVIYLYFRPGSPMLDVRFGTTPNLLPLPRPNVAQLLQGPFAIAAVCAGVVALVRWVPTWLVAVPLFFLLFVQGLYFGIFDSASTSAFTWLWPMSTGAVHRGWTGCDTDNCLLRLAGYDQVTPWWHLAYLVALGAWFVTIAVLRHRRDRAAWTAFAVALATVVLFAAVQAFVYVQPTGV